MNRTILILLFVFMCSQWVDAQIKRQYKDEKHVRQTVVVKTEKSVSDMDILNSQFDLDDVAVGDVIRITTETDPNAKAKPKPLAEVAPETTTIESKPEANVTEEEKVPIQVEEVQEVPQVLQEKPVKSISTTTKETKQFYKKSKFKIRKPRFKKKKRKRVKRSRVKCYRF